MSVMTLAGSARVAAVVVTKVKDELLCQVGDLSITTWHPIWMSGAWRFPVDEARSEEEFTGSIYSILLEPHSNPDMHSIEIGGQWATTLGHGITQPGEDCRAHPYFGDWTLIAQDLRQLSELTHHGADDVLESAGIVRSTDSGLACGFKPATFDTAQL
jgi:hypothetical protein